MARMNPGLADTPVTDAEQRFLDNEYRHIDLMANIELASLATHRLTNEMERLGLLMAAINTLIKWWRMRGPSYRRLEAQVSFRRETEKADLMFRRAFPGWKYV